MAGKFIVESTDSAGNKSFIGTFQTKGKAWSYADILNTQLGVTARVVTLGKPDPKLLTHGKYTVY
jgi:hypothetical protein